MTFNSFINQLSNELKLPLPGQDAQFKMAPSDRVDFEKYSTLQVNAKKSAVLILFYPHFNSISTVLILRQSYHGIHSAQVSFPGGKIEESDPDVAYTALRETQEEIGVNILNVNVIGQLSSLYVIPSNYKVFPFVGYTLNRPKFLANQKEVKKIIEVDLKNLTNPEIIKSGKIKHSSTGKILNTPYYDINDEIVWGATAMMISELNAILQKLNYFQNI